MERYSACTCHPDTFNEAPATGILISFGSCARYCPFCNFAYTNCPNLRQHLQSSRKKTTKCPKLSPTAIIRVAEGASRDRSSASVWELIEPTPVSLPSPAAVAAPIPPHGINVGSFDNWKDRGLERVLPLLVGIEEASADPVLRSLWEDKFPQVSQQDPQNPHHLIGLLANQIMLDIPKKKANLRRGMSQVIGSLTAQREHLGVCLTQISLPSAEMKSSAPCSCINVFVNNTDNSFPTEWRSSNTVLHQVPGEGHGMSFHVCPAGTFTDLHVDACTIGRAICFGNCVKGWLCFPPSDKNLRLWQAGQGAASRLASYGAELEGGVFVKTGNDLQSVGNCIELGSGTIHAVVTLEGGLLGGVNYSFGEDMILASRMLRLQIDRWAKLDDVLEDAQWYRVSLRACFLEADPRVYPAVWYNHGLLRDTLDTFPKRKDHVVYLEIKMAEEEVWKYWKKTYEDENRQIRCHCEVMYDSWKVHFTPGTCSLVREGMRLFG